MRGYTFFMRLRRSLALLPGLLALIPLAASALPRPDAPDHAAPFLRAPAETVKELVREVQADRMARVRYAAFFHVQPRAVASYIQHNLTPGVLPSAGAYTAYFVSEEQRIYPVWLPLPAGARVFVTHGGAPVLLCSTGDPLKSTLKPVVAKPLVTVSSTPPLHP